MKLFFRKNFYIIFLLDICLVITSYYFAYWLRYEGLLQTDQYTLFKKTLPPLLLFKLCCFFFFDLYVGMWRYTGTKDLINVLKASIGGSALTVAYLAAAYRFVGISRSVILIDFIITCLTIGGVRFLIRLYFQLGPELYTNIFFWRKPYQLKKRILILGTGHLAERLFRALTRQSSNYDIIGFVDESLQHKGMKIHGIPILGALLNIPALIEFYSINDIFIAIPDISSFKLKKLIEICTGHNVRFKVIPDLKDWIGDNLNHQMRDIKVEDLLDRETINLDMSIVKENILGKIVLVTGAGGSIGSELARQILTFKPKHLILLDNAETPLYDIDMELSKKEKDTTITPAIGDIRTQKGLDRIFRMYNPQIVYHAAAYKHVPLMEMTPDEAAKNNILGTFKLASIACKYNVENFVMISTDKAVKPSSVMGATKRIAEMIVQSMNGKGTRFSVVRFGNVLASNGSVVPLFEKQIKDGGPVTVTHPDITRYFMTIPEAVMLVLQAGAMSKGGELFLLDMGEPVKIVDLARNMIRLAGFVPDKDINIVFTGLRPGEKLYEELLIAGEDVVATALNKIKICKNTNGFSKDLLFDNIGKMDTLLNEFCEADVILEMIKTMVPAYRKQADLYKKEISIPDGYYDIEINTKNTNI